MSEGIGRQRGRDRWLGVLVLLAVVAAVLLLVRMTREGMRELVHPTPPPRPAPAYHEVQRLTLAMREPMALAVDPRGAVHVAGDRTVTQVWPVGGRVVQTPLPSAPTCLAVAADGTRYVGLRDHVEVYRGARRVARWASCGSKAVLTSIALTPNVVWVADAGNRTLWRYTLAGKGTQVVSDLVVPSPYLDVAADTNGVWLTNPGRHRVEQHAPDGTLMTHWGTPSFEAHGFSGCCNPTQVAVLPNGHLVTAEKGLPRVKVYRPDGTLDATVADTLAHDLATNNSGQVLVLDGEERVVRVYGEKAP